MAKPNNTPLSVNSKDIERFWKKVDILEPDKCWNWIGGSFPDGYGCFWLSGRSHLAHRVAYFIHFGVDPGDLLVCHHCDNKKCCNPSHFFLGTALDNNRDMWDKGRGPSGERSGAYKHPERIARGERHGWHKYPEVIPRGDRSGSRKHPESLKRGDEHWTRLHPEKLARGERNGSHKYPERLPRGDDHFRRKHPEKVYRGEQQTNAKLTDEQVREIRSRYAQGGITYKQLAAEYNVTFGLIGHIISRRAWKHLI